MIIGYMNASPDIYRNGNLKKKVYVDLDCKSFEEIIVCIKRTRLVYILDNLGFPFT